MITRRATSFATILALLGLAACSTPPPPPARPVPPMPPAHAPTEDAGVVAPSGITLLVGGSVVSLEQLQAGGFPPDQTVTVAAKSSTPYSEVAAMLVKLHEMGYLVAFSSAD